MAVADLDPYTELRDRLRTDFPFYAEKILRIVGPGGKVVPFVLKAEQQRLWDELQARRAQGYPMWALILKARKIGFSTMAQGMIFQRTTTTPNHTSLTVAQDNKTAGELMAMFELMYNHLPTHPDFAFLRPAIANQRKRAEMHFGEPARNNYQRGNLGLNSKILIDTAREFNSGRGFTFRSVHGSEVGQWDDLDRKLLAILNAVPHDDPETLVLLEGTAQGLNAYHKMWKQAIDGTSDFLPFFSPWFEDPRNVRKFVSDEERQQFESDLGCGPWGEDEPYLVELGLSLEQLRWRRWSIQTQFNSDLQNFHQENPATWEEAFASSGRHVFAPLLVKKVRQGAEVSEKQARKVLLEKSATKLRRGRFVSIEVPTAVRERVPSEHSRTDLYWRFWDDPREKGQYIVVVDPASGEERSEGEPDFTGIQVLDHVNRVQVAELQSRADPDLIAEQALLVCLKYTVLPHKPLLVVEMTGGYGTSIADRLYKEYGYTRMYRRKPIDPRRREKTTDLIGFSTDRNTKPRLIDGLKELVREGTHGVRSLRLANEFGTYQRTKNGTKLEAAPGSFDDLLMPFGIAHYVAQEVPPRPDRTVGRVVDLATRRVSHPKLGY